MNEDTCLITGAVLSGANSEEHTLLRSLGGRIRSRRVSSPKLNNGTSDFDSMLFGPYRLIFNYLSPFLSAEHRPGAMEVEIEGKQRRVQLAPGNRLQMKGVTIAGRDQSGFPNAIEAPTTQLARQHADKLRWTGEIRESIVPVTTKTEIRSGGYALHWKMEVSALKCVLLAFDELLYGNEHRFTRRPEVIPTLNTVYQAIFNPKFDATNLENIVWGIDNSKVDFIRDLRRQLCPEPVTPFENIIVATADPGLMTLDIGWLIAGTDFFRFRLSNKWQGLGFTIVSGGGILVGTHALAPGFLERPISFGGISGFRTNYTSGLNPAKISQAMQELSKHRADSVNRALLFAELNNGNVLSENLEGNARKVQNLTNQDTISVLDAIKFRIRTLYQKTAQVVFERAFSEAVESQNLPVDTFAEKFTFHAEKDIGLDFGPWLQIYRGVLNALVQELGIPQVTWLERMEVEPQ